MRVWTCGHRVPQPLPYVRGTRTGLLRTVRARGAACGAADYSACAVRVPASGAYRVPCWHLGAPQAAECASEGSHAVALAETSRGLYVDSAAVCARLVEQPGGDCMPQVGIDR